MKNDNETVMEREVNGEDLSTSRKAGDLPEALIESDENNLIGELEDTKFKDYSTFSKRDFANLIKELSKGENVKATDAILKEIKPLFDEIRGKERTEALQKFKSDGGKAEDFEFKLDEFDIAFDAAYRLIKDKRTNFYKQLETEKNLNFNLKTELLEKLRALADSEDTEHSFHLFKDIQREWKQVGAVPPAQAKNLWANYSALVDRFYDNRSIYFELKELDRRRNLEAKIELCHKAEELIKVDRIKDAILELNELHHEFRHVGPVPLEEKEPTWQRFKAASDAIYARRDEYVSNLQHELVKNLTLKNQVVEEVITFSNFQSDRIKEWNQKTHEILDLQKKWETIGGIPRSKTKDINKKFWTAFKSFFNNKNVFFKKLDEERDKNLALKNDIIKKAQELKESQEWDKTANELKGLQRQWQELGPVPEKFREKLFQEFKTACDHFFEQRRLQFEARDHEQEVVLKEKESICAELEKIAAEKSGTLELLSSLQTKFSNLGFVPKNAMAAIKTRCNKAVELFLASIEGVSPDEKERFELEMQLKELKDDPQAEQKIYHKEQTIRKRISKVENDIAVLRNNLEFFGRSKNAELMKSEFSVKIKDADDQLKTLRKQLKMLKTV